MTDSRTMWGCYSTFWEMERTPVGPIEARLDRIGKPVVLVELVQLAVTGGHSVVPSVDHLEANHSSSDGIAAMHPTVQQIALADLAARVILLCRIHEANQPSNAASVVDTVDKHANHISTAF